MPYGFLWIQGSTKNASDLQGSVIFSGIALHRIVVRVACSSASNKMQMTVGS